MKKSKMIEKMIAFYDGNISDIDHFLKVYAYAKLIGELEGVDEKTQEIIEIAAIVHDISCPLCREKYGNTNGEYQELESEALLTEFIEEFHLPQKLQERVIHLVTHHHTYTAIDGVDYQILIEADYIVNAGESQKYFAQMKEFQKNIFHTKSGKRILETIYKTQKNVEIVKN